MGKGCDCRKGPDVGEGSSKKKGTFPKGFEHLGYAQEEKRTRSGRSGTKRGLILRGGSRINSHKKKGKKNKSGVPGGRLKALERKRTVRRPKGM